MAPYGEEIVELQIAFSCPNGHKIERTFTHFQEHRASRLIDEQSFDLECSRCSWKGTMTGRGHQSIDIVRR